jgi:FtsP/CotA-like multicopper oxidase with cupredoxin domain
MKNFLTSLLVLGTLFLLNSNVSYSQLAGQLPLNPKNIPQFVDPLPHFAGQRVDASGGDLTIRYTTTSQVAVSTGTVLLNGTVGLTPGAGMAKFWAYSVSTDGVTYTPPYWPSFTIVAQKGIPVNVTYENNLFGQTYADVNLIADQTLHWADPLMNGMGMMDPYIGPIPVSPHLHGGEVPSESDGGPDSWFTPNYEHVGPSWDLGVDEQYFYPNTQEEATLWYHDHALGVTRLNVYAGLAGFYFLKGPDEESAQLPGWSGDDLVQEVAPAGKTQVFNPNPYLPEIEVVFQDRMFDTYGGLYFPNLPPNPMDHPFWTPEFVGDIITVNGKTWPYLSVAPRKYRFRLLNGSNARFYEIWLQDLVTGVMGPAIVQIGTDGGLLDAPVAIAGKLLLGPGERADVVIDFSASAPGQVWTLKNSGNTPYPKGTPPNGSTTGRLMQFIVNGQMVSAADLTSVGTDKSQLPTNLRSKPIVQLTNFAGIANILPDVKRQLTLNEVMGMGGPLEVLVNNTKWDGNGMDTPGLGETEFPVEGTTEMWQIINLTADAHPIHLHLVQFQLVSRQKFNVSNYNKAYNAAFGGAYVPAFGPPLPYGTANTDGALGGNPAVTPYLQGAIKPANLNERGWKDTYIVMPGEVTTFMVRYAPTDLPLNTPAENLLYGFDPGVGPGYVWHCHIIDHEDNEMMRPYKVISSPARGSSLKSSTSFNSEIKSSVEPDGFSLGQNYPNPFAYETEIQFTLPESAHVTLTLHNQLGQQVYVLIDSEAPAGLNIVKLSGENLRNGIYFYKLKTGNFEATKRMIIVK